MLLHEIGYTEPEYNANAWYMYIYATTALTTKMSRDKEHSMTIYACDCVCAGPPMGRVKLELTFNPDTSMVGVRLHEHTLSTTKTGSPFIVCIIVKTHTPHSTFTFGVIITHMLCKLHISRCVYKMWSLVHNIVLGIKQNLRTSPAQYFISPSTSRRSYGI